MAGITAAASLAEALRDQRVEGVVHSFFRNDEVLGSGFATREFTGGSTINITHHYAGNASVGVFEEGDAIGEAGSQSYLVAKWSPTYYKGVMSHTGHAVDQIRNGASSAVWFDPIAKEFERIIPDMTHKISTDMLGTGLTPPVGIQGICDNAGTIATILRSTYTWYQAFEGTSLTSSTVVTVADIDSAMYQSQDQPYEGAVDQIWTSWKQKYKRREAIGHQGVSNSPIRRMDPAMEGRTGSVIDDDSHGGVPIRPKKGLDNSIWLGITTSTMFIGDMRAWTVAEQGVTGDSRKFLVTRALGLGSTDPRKNWKLTGYST